MSETNRTELVRGQAVFDREMSVEGFEIQRSTDPAKGSRIAFSAASDYPVERWYGVEILDMSKGAMRSDRLRSGSVPLLFNHNMDQPIGMVDAKGGTDGKRLNLEADFFPGDPEAAVTENRVANGLRNVSIRYRVHSVEEVMTGADAGKTFIRDWEILEASIVTIPADPTVGVGRAVSDEEFEVRVMRAAEQVKAPSGAEKNPATPVVITVESRKMDEQIIAPGGNGEKPIGAVEAEKERREAIINLCKSNRIDNRVQGRWIEQGTPLTAVAKEILDVMEERGKLAPVAASEVGLSRKDTQQYSLFRAIRALRFGSSDPKYMDAAKFEIECSRQVAKQIGREGSTGILVPGEVLVRSLGDAATRAMAVSPGAKGGYMVSVENAGFIDILRNRSVAMRMGARQLSGLTGNVMFPRQTGKPTVTWQAGEGVSVTAADQTLGQLSMTPKTCIAITDVSEQLLRQSSPSAEAFVMADLAADVAIDGVDAAVINGTGGAQPLGIKNTTGITSGQDSATCTYAKLLAFPVAAGGANAIRGNPGWVTNIAGAAVLMQKQRFTSTDTPVWVGNLLDGSLVGFNAMSSEQLASGNLIFGSWDELVIGDWGVLELSTDNGGTRFNQAQVGIRAMWMVDVMLRYPQAFVVSTNLSA